MPSKSILFVVFFAFVISRCKNNSSGAEIGQVCDTCATTSDTSPGHLTKDLFDLIPPGYSILDTVRGDVNGDSLRDVIMVLKNNGEDTVLNGGGPKDRLVFVLTGMPGGGLLFAARNDAVVFWHDGGGVYGDPYKGIEITGNGFIVRNFGGSFEKWSWDCEFRYSSTDRKWFLAKLVNGNYGMEQEDDTAYVYSKKDFGNIDFAAYDNGKVTKLITR